VDEYDENVAGDPTEPFRGRLHQRAVLARSAGGGGDYAHLRRIRLRRHAPGAVSSEWNRGLHGRILTVLLATARARAPLRSSNREGSRAQREVLARRTAALRQVLDGVDLAPVLGGAARNSIERFDEYVDGVAIQSYRGAIPRPTLFAVDMVLSTRSLLEQFDAGGERPTPHFIRACIVDGRVFINCGRELRLEPRGFCYSAIRRRVELLLPDFARGERGGSVPVVT
jgi:hypothetical protein